MANISIQNWENILTPRFSYVDESLSIKTTTTVYEQGFSITQADALVNLNSQSTNNYNMLYLSTRQNVSDVVELDKLEYSLNSLTTTLRFRDTDTDETKYIKFVGNSYELVDNKSQDDDSTTFQLKFIDEHDVLVKHISENDEYRLCIDTNDSVFFATSGISTLNTLRYIIDADGYLALYTKSVPSKILTKVGNSLTVRSLSAGALNRSSDVLIEIDNTFTPLTYNINQNWVSYDRTDLNLASIDQTRSAFSLPNQFLISTSYNSLSSTVDVNFFNLKNNVSEGNFIKRGSTLNNGSITDPGVDFRFYTSLNTGNTQEKGNENIVLSYVFYDKDIIVKSGTDTAFSTPESIYPYDRLNINDTKFIENGAHGSYIPQLADNVLKLRRDSQGFNNGRYLCTWLSGNAMNDSYLWVDRYYYPDVVNKETAFTIPTYQASFIDPVDDMVFSTGNKARIKDQPVFDKRSDFFFEPSTNYIYRRISNQDFADHITSISASEVFSSVDPVVYNGNTIYSVDTDTINSSGKFTLSFDMHLTPNRTYGHAILGNLTNYGFSVLNDTFITPVLVTLSGSSVIYHNTYPEQIGIQKFDRTVKDVIRFDSLDNYIVVCSDGYVYEVRYDNIIQNLNIVPELSTYLNYAVSDDQITFLLNTSGDCLSYDKATRITSSIQADNPSGDSVGGIFYRDGVIEGVIGGNVKRYDTDNVCYLSDNTIFRYDPDLDNTIPIIKALSGIIDYAIDENGNYLMLHNTDKITLLNKNRQIVFTQSLSSIATTGVKCEFIKQYNYGQNTTYIAVALVDIANNMQIALYDHEGVMRAMGACAGTLSNTNTNFTNYNYHIGYTDKTSLRFKISMQNAKDFTDVISETLKYDYSAISEGYVNLVYTFDSLNGYITLAVNGSIVDTARFDPAKYIANRVFSDRIVIGATGFYNGITLSNFLQQPEYYYVTGTTLRNVYIYDTALKPGDTAALSLRDMEIQPLALSIPCGQRNNIEEIVRYFKFSVPGSSSNHINIEIKNSSIQDEGVKDSIIADIKQNINKYIKSDVIIDDITFVDYIQS